MRDQSSYFPFKKPVLGLLIFALSAMVLQPPNLSAATMDERIAVATGILASRQGSMEPIPQALLDSCLGVAVVSITKGGLIFGGTGGQGVVIAKTLRSPASPVVIPQSPTDSTVGAAASPSGLQPFVQPTPEPVASTTTTVTLADGSTVTEQTTTSVTPPVSVSGPSPSDALATPAPGLMGDPALPIPTLTTPPPQPVLAWCAPSAFDVAGGSVGFQAGVKTMDLIIIINSPESLAMFTSPGKVAWSGAATGTAGAQSAGVGVNDLEPQPVMVFSASGGVYGGATLGGTSISMNEKVNLDAYGQNGYIRDILGGVTRAPASSHRLYEILVGGR